MAEVKYVATGRRKDAVARVQLVPGGGQIRVNNRTLDDYFTQETLQVMIRQPLVATESLDKFDVIANVKGGGISGQASAIRHGIARALVKVDEALRQTLKKGGYITRDPRMKERKKYGQKGARKRFQWTKR